jgi:hypothetical protein
MINRILKRPMFRIGGSSSDGIMTGLDKPRKGFSSGTKPPIFLDYDEETGYDDKQLEEAGILDAVPKSEEEFVPGVTVKDKFFPYGEQDEISKGALDIINTNRKKFAPKDESNVNVEDTENLMLLEAMGEGKKNKDNFNLEELKEGDDDVKSEFERRRALSESLLGKSALPMSSFLTQFGLNLASASPRGGLIATAAQAAKEPLKTFQAMKVQERSEDKDLLESVIESMSEEDLSALEKKVKRGVESGFFKTEAEGYRSLLKKELEGVQFGPGELDRINVSRYADAYVKSEAGGDLTLPAAESVFRVYQQVEKGNIEGADTSKFDPNRYHISGVEKQAEIVNGEETGRDILVLNDELDKEDYFKGSIYVNPGENRVYRFDGNKFVQVGE